MKNKMTMRYAAVALAFVAAGFVLGGYIAAGVQESITGNPPIFSKRNMLESLWYRYKSEYLEPATLRALDLERNGITTSEGQSYTMLRAVWLDDKATFDTAWQWTKDNLQRDEDHLFSWLFGERADGTYGILTDQGGQNAATDSDTDIAVALLFASERWNNNDYFGDAIEIIRDIWANEVVMIGGKPYILANNIEKFDLGKEEYIVNPSYFAPYAYKIFAEADPAHDWLGVVDTSYEVIAKNAQSPLDAEKSAGIPSDWVSINRNTAAITAVPQAPDLTTNYSYDALRLPWRLALDARWFGEPRAEEALRGMSFFSDQWRENGAVYASYRHDGSALELQENGAMYGGLIGYFMVADPALADEVYAEKIESLYDQTLFNWKEGGTYYDSNWVWFGMALYADLLPQLYPTPSLETAP